MECTGTEKLTEFEFIRSAVRRGPGDCCGPLLKLSFAGYRLEILEDSFGSPAAYQTLWNGFHSGHGQLTFILCAAHWMDLSYLSGMHAQQAGRADWFAEASTLLQQICWAADWDVKEIANMVMWQRVRLT